MSKRANRLERAACFVDGGYLQIAPTRAQAGFPVELTYAVLENLRKALIQNQSGGVLHYYDWLGGEQNEGRVSLLQRIRTKDYFVVHQLKRWDRSGSGRAAILSAIALDMVDFAHRNHFDHAIMLAGDDVLVPAIERVQTLGRQVHVYGFANDMDHDLMRAATTVSLLTPANFKPAEKGRKP